MLQIFLENLDKIHTILIKSIIWQALVFTTVFFSIWNFYYLFAEIIKGLPCLSGNENLQDNWAALIFTYIIVMIPILPVVIILQLCFPDGLPNGREVPGLPGYYYYWRGIYHPPTVEEQKILSFVLLSIILLSIILTLIFKILIYYKTNKNRK